MTPHVERTSGDGDDFINATTVAAEPFYIDGASETTSPPAMRSEDTVLLKLILLDKEVAQHVKPMGTEMRPSSPLDSPRMVRQVICRTMKWRLTRHWVDRLEIGPTTWRKRTLPRMHRLEIIAQRDEFERDSRRTPWKSVARQDSC